MKKALQSVVHTFIITNDEPPFQEDRLILHSQGGGGPLGITIIMKHTNFLATFLGRSGSTNLFKSRIFHSHSSSVVRCTFISFGVSPGYAKLWLEIRRYHTLLGLLVKFSKLSLVFKLISCGQLCGGKGPPNIAM